MNPSLRKIINAPRQVAESVLNRLFEILFRKSVLRLVYSEPYVFGVNPVRIAPSACVNNAILNTMSGTITIEDNVSFGHNVSLLTGTHNLAARNEERQEGWPKSGRDIVIRRGAWIASNATIVGPCVIGEHSVVAAGAVVLKDVPPSSMVGGVPAKFIKHISCHE